MKHVLLTGATGFLGSHLLEALLEQGYRVTILKRSTSNTWRIDHLLGEVRSYDLDVVPIVKVFDEQSVDLIIHLSTLYRKVDNGTEISQMTQANITFPLELLECAVRYNVKGFINTGTFFECDCSELPLKESANEKPFNFYAKTKIIFEKALTLYACDLPSITLRLFSPYGEKDNQKIIPILINKALKGESVKLSDGLQKLDFIYVKDVVSAYLKAIKKLNKTVSGHEIYNVGSGLGVSIREVVSILEQKLGRQIKKEWGGTSSNDIPAVFADMNKAFDGLGWEPLYSIHHGLEKTLEYYESTDYESY